jgi:tRNA pseudouridine38-40 synthase
LQYSGHGFGGWQYQNTKGEPKLPSIQGTLCTALNKLLITTQLEPRELVAAGRTDAGVHAWAQVVHVDLPESYASRTLHSWVDGLNRYLPHSIRVIAARVVDDAFHARFSALSRAYVYKLWLGRQLRPDLLHSAGHLFAPVGATPDIAAMQAALASLPVGTPTDYSSLRDAQCQSKNPVCTLTHARLEHTEPQLLTLHIGADHFLHHMVRNLVGTLAQVGLGQREANLMPLIAAQDRTLAGTTFSPNGLYLSHVVYPEPYALPVLE